VEARVGVLLGGHQQVAEHIVLREGAAEDEEEAGRAVRAATVTRQVPLRQAVCGVEEGVSALEKGVAALEKGVAAPETGSCCADSPVWSD